MINKIGLHKPLQEEVGRHRRGHEHKAEEIYQFESIKVLRRLDKFPVTYDINGTDLYIHAKLKSELDEKNRSELEHISGVELSFSNELLASKKIITLGIKEPGKEHAKVINTIDDLVGYDESSILNLEHHEQLKLREKMLAHVTSLVTELHPRQLARTALKHGPWLGTALLAGTVIDHLILPYFAITSGHPEIFGVTLLHLPEIACMAAYAVGRKIYSDISQKERKYGNDLDKKITNYLECLEKGEHELCESVEVRMERDLHVDMALGGREDMENMNIMINHDIDYIQTGSKSDLSVVHVLSKMLNKRLRGSYQNWKAYISAIAIEHMAEFSNDEFGARELIRYKVFRDYILNVIPAESFHDVAEGLGNRLTTHHTPGKSHDPNCPCYAIACGDLS
ncbi:MAG: hypothetical protein KAK00_01865 [Nanoarchaeota archaeon]|nr:hypothetical protein [Nanoarchaeota archaeon]